MAGPYIVNNLSRTLCEASDPGSGADVDRPANSTPGLRLHRVSCIMERLSVKALARDCSPFEWDVWDCGEPASLDGVRSAIEGGHTVSPRAANRPQVGEIVASGAGWRWELQRDHVSFHEARIAWFAVHGWNRPIEVDFGMEFLGFDTFWPVADGNHRLAAAIYRKDAGILADCAGETRLIRKYSLKGKR